MAITQLLKAEVVLSRADTERFATELERQGLMHLEDINARVDEETRAIEEKPRIATSGVDAILADSRWVIDLFHRFAPVNKGLLEDFFGSNPYVDSETVEKMLAAVDLPQYRQELEQTFLEYEAAQARLADLRDTIIEVRRWAALAVELADLGERRWTSLLPVRVEVGQFDNLAAGIVANDGIAFHEVSRDRRSVLGVIVAIVDETDAARTLLKQARAEEVSLPALTSRADDAVRELQAEVDVLDARATEIADFFRHEAEEKRHLIHAYADEYQGRRAVLVSGERFFFTRHVAVVSGWIRKRQRDAFEQFVTDNYPDARFQLNEPQRDETPPVELDNGRLTRPFQTLIDMYGKPRYFGIDPTPFVAVAMTLFYALCLGDAGYGVLQVALTTYLMRRFKSAGDTRLFLTMLRFVGIVTIVVGVLTWSFFGVSPGYDGGDKLFGLLPILSPTIDIIPLIIVSIVIGVGFQLASIVAGLINSLRERDFTTAVFDHLAWLVLIIGVLLIVAAAAVESLAGLRSIAWGVAFAGGATIIFFGGRDSKGFVGRILAGVISLYGIVGYYGLVGFFSDVLSYMRLAILNLTSAFIALVANLIGELIISTSGNIVLTVVSIIFGGVIVVGFHILNLVLSMLGAFVHSLRLNFLESFQRYYPDGGRSFMPLKRTGRYFRFEE